MIYGIRLNTSLRCKPLSRRTRSRIRRTLKMLFSQRPIFLLRGSPSTLYRCPTLGDKCKFALLAPMNKAEVRRCAQMRLGDSLCRLHTTQGSSHVPREHGDWHSCSTCLKTDIEIIHAAKVKAWQLNYGYLDSNVVIMLRFSEEACDVTISNGCAQFWWVGLRTVG